MEKRYTLFLVIGSAILLVLILSYRGLFFTIQPGERAVLFKKFAGGLDKETVYRPGFHVKMPWNDVYVYDVTENKEEETLDVLDKNGLTIQVDISARFRPRYEKIGYIYETFQLDYINRLVIPEIRSTVRQIMGRYTAEEIYSTKRSEVEQSISHDSKTVLGSDTNNIEVTALLIRSIKLPVEIKQAIESKLKQEQEALAYQFRLEKERSEAERKRIAAEGEARANTIVSSSLNANLLKMRGIEATILLSESENSKVIVIGNSKDGLPLILGNP